MDGNKLLTLWMIVLALLGTERFGFFPSFIDSDGWPYKFLVFVVAFVGLLLTIDHSRNRLPKEGARALFVLLWVLIIIGVIILGYTLNESGLEQLKEVMSNYTDGFTFYALSLSFLMMIITNKSQSEEP